jgi:hypothetical protein
MPKNVPIQQNCFGLIDTIHVVDLGHGHLNFYTEDGNRNNTHWFVLW